MVKLFQDVDKGGHTWSAVGFVGAEDAGERFFAVKGNPCELAAVVIEKTGRKADPSSCGYIGERCVVVRAVEILDLAGTDQSVLD